MFLSSLSSSIVFSTIEYFSYLNIWLIILFLFLCFFFFILCSCQLLICSIYCSGAVFEFSLIFLSFLFVVIIISPALIILLDTEIILVPSFIVYSCGYQWAWTFSFYYLNWISNCDHYLCSSYYLLNYCSSYLLVNQLRNIIWTNGWANPLSQCRFLFSFISSSLSFNKVSYLSNLIWSSLSSLILDNNNTKFILIPSLFYLNLNPNLNLYSSYFTSFSSYLYSPPSIYILKLGSLYTLVSNYSLFDLFNLFDLLIKHSSSTNLTSSFYLNALSSLINLFYFFTCNTTILIPILSTIRFFIFSYDVIHSLGIYSFGIKIDAIPGRFNYTSTIRTHIKGEHRGFCYELCGHGHSSMIIVVKTL